MELEGQLLNLFIPQNKGACIAHFRNMLDLTQTEISIELGINRTVISKMENGDMSVSENVWNYILHLVYQDFNLEHNIPFVEFRNTLNLMTDNEEIGGKFSGSHRSSPSNGK